MKIPDEIKGKNRLRDLLICLDYISGLMPEEIIEARKLRLTVRRIEQVLYTNAAFINPRIGWPKAKRLHYLQKCIDKVPSSKKDNADLIYQISKELEEDKALVDNSTHYHFFHKVIEKPVLDRPNRLESYVTQD